MDLADELGGLGDDGEAAGVAGGELEAVEEDGGALGVDGVHGEGADDLGEGELDGFAVLEGGEIDDGAVVDKRGAAGDLVAVLGVSLVEPAVEVAEVVVGDGDTAALEAVGLDVAAEIGLHGGSWGTPLPRGVVGVSLLV